jgi:hypothetical protein
MWPVDLVVLAQFNVHGWDFFVFAASHIGRAVLFAVDYIPEVVSYLFLGVGGLVMSVPSLVDKIDKRPRLRRTFVVICFVLGGLGVLSSVRQRHESESQMRSMQGDVHALIGSTNVLVNSTNTVVLALPQISALNTRMDDLGKKIEAAKGNPELVSSLQAQLTTARAQADAIARSRLLAMLPGVVGQMKSLEMKWRLEDIAVTDQIYQYRSDIVYFEARHISVKQRVEELLKKQSDQDVEYSMQAAQLIVSVDYLRQQLLQGSEPNQDDRQIASTLAKLLAGETIQWHQMKLATDYMEKLANKLNSTAIPSRGVK